MLTRRGIVTGYFRREIFLGIGQVASNEQTAVCVSIFNAVFSTFPEIFFKRKERASREVVIKK